MLHVQSALVVVVVVNPSSIDAHDSGTISVCNAASSVYNEGAHTIGAQLPSATSATCSARWYGFDSQQFGSKLAHGAEQEVHCGTLLMAYIHRQVYGVLWGGKVHKQYWIITCCVCV